MGTLKRLTQACYIFGMISLEERLVQILSNSPWYASLRSIRDLQLPQAWVAGGAVRNTVWKELYRDKCQLGIKDLDLVFFDPASKCEFERSIKEKLEKLHPGWEFDVKNQASFGRWRPWKFSFENSIDGIAHFLHTATAVGVRLTESGEPEIVAPHGLQDLFSGCIRCTPYRHGLEEAESKQKEFLSMCPELTVSNTDEIH